MRASIAATASMCVLLADWAQPAGPRMRPVAASCSEAVYTTAAGAPPKPVQAVTIGPAVFNSLAQLTTGRGIDKPTRGRPFYIVKSPLTVLAGAGRGVIVTLVRGGEDAILLYDRIWQGRWAQPRRFDFARAPRTVRLPLCRDARTKRPLNTQYAGGLVLRRLECVTIDVRAIGETRTERATVPIGVRRC